VPANKATAPAHQALGEIGMAPATLGARRPIISADDGVVGFEFRISGELRARFRRKPDARAQAAYAATVLTSARLTTSSGRIGLARLPADWLSHKVEAEVSKGVMVAIDRPTDENTLAEGLKTVEAGLTALRKAGARIGWPEDMNLTLNRDFVLIRQRKQLMPKLLEQIKTWPVLLQNLPILATDVSHLEDVELALNNGIRYVCGSMAPREDTAAKDALPLSPEAQRIGQLLQQLVTGAETPVIVGQIKGDVGLSYRLLRRLKTAELAHLNECTSIDQAVQLLGRNELYRWLSVLLLKSPGNRKAASAMHEIALWRARLLELLAIERKEPAPGQLFTLGLASMLGPLLKITPQEVVDTLSLNSHGSQALLQQVGPWASYLQVSRAIETHTLDEAAELTAPFGGPELIAELSDQAWNWAAASVRFVREDAPS